MKALLSTEEMPDNFWTWMVVPAGFGWKEGILDCVHGGEFAKLEVPDHYF